MRNYNYDGFTSKTYNLDTFTGPDIGDKAKDFSLTTVDHKTTKLLEFDGDFLVLELGSITCPLFQGRREGMSDLIEQFPSARFSVLYVREAHPGSNFPAHQTLEDKTRCATELKHVDKEKRKILIDDIAGTAHKGYGSYPNAIFIINKQGCVVFRSDWNNVSATKAALKALIAGKPAHSKSYFLPVKPTTAIKTLRKSGKGATSDFFKGLPTLIWKNVIKRNVLLFLNSGKSIPADASC